VGPPEKFQAIGNFFLDTQDVGVCKNCIVVLAYPMGYSRLY